VIWDRDSAVPTAGRHEASLAHSRNALLGRVGSLDTGWIEQAADQSLAMLGKSLRWTCVRVGDRFRHARLAQLPDLKRLELSLTRISDRGLRALKTAPAIEELNLYFAEQISDEGAAIVKGWKHLKHLNLPWY